MATPPLRTVHLILQAHIDPVWVWPWTAGVDEALNTCASMCDLLDRHPEAIFTRGESWVYEQVRQHDPALFRRILGHIRGGRWSPVGGWYIQPDCNLPGEESMRRQISAGKAWFEEHVGLFPKIGYNVDSFGHTAALPDIMAAHGQHSYVMMRPMDHERTLPSRVFRWRGFAGGREITTFRIANGYATIFEPTLGHIERALEGLPPGVNDTMCFLGVGDHGGGPTEAILRWCRANWTALPGVRLVYSSPERYFKAIARQVPNLPLVTGELQMHAIGCYSVHRPVKVGVRRGENILAQAQRALELASPAERREAAPKLKGAWEQVLFNTFHDTLGGSCIATANRYSEEQLAFAATIGERVLSRTFRRRAHALRPDRRQRFAIANYSGVPFSDWIEHEPWLEWTSWKPDWCLLDEKGRVVPTQVIEAEPLMPDSTRVLFPLEVEPGKLRVVRVARLPKGRKPALKGAAPSFRLTLTRGRAVLKATGAPAFAVPDLELIEDKSDTWSHGLDRFSGPLRARPRWEKPEKVEDGLLRCTWRLHGTIAGSAVCADWRRYRSCDWWEVRLRVNWCEQHKLLRLSWDPGAAILSRNDGIPGRGLDRESDGKERPTRDRSLLRLKGGRTAGAVFPDVFSMSGDAERLRLTLLRSSPLAHHDPKILPPKLPHANWADRGDHVFTMRFHPAGRVTAAVLDAEALLLQQKPVVADLTRGMPYRPYKDQADWPV
jgi:alpha-mannosidase